MIKIDKEIEKMIENDKNPLCPKCTSKLEEDWEQRENEFGEKMGKEYEIYRCPSCGHVEFI